MFETNPTSDASPMAKLNSSRAARFTLIGVLAMFLLTTLVASPAAAQTNVDICSEMNNEFIDFVQSAVTLLVVGGVVLGTFGILMGFISEASPWLSSSSYSELKSKGVIYGWGIPAVLYFLTFMSEMIFGSSWGCLMPF